MKSNFRISQDGYKIWENENGKYHREDGPAVDAGSFKMWYINGKLHRENGPAIEDYSTGYKSWYYYGQYINCTSQEEFERIISLFIFKN